MSMYSDMCGEKKETNNCVLRIHKPWQDVQEDSRTDIGDFSGLDQKRNGTEITRKSRTEKWDHVVEDMMIINFSESGHPSIQIKIMDIRGNEDWSSGGGEKQSVTTKAVTQLTSESIPYLATDHIHG